MTLHWQESGGPPVGAPASQGFGTKIMNASIKHQLGGNVTWDWRSSGLHCTLQIPLGIDGDLPNRTVPAAEENLVKLPTGTMKRVLLAEDEAIIGMMMREFLLEYGVFVVGPCCTLTRDPGRGQHGIRLRHPRPQSRRRVRFIPSRRRSLSEMCRLRSSRATARESLDGRFENVPILQKPITRESLEICLRDMLQQRPIAGGKDVPAIEAARTSSSALRA